MERALAEPFVERHVERGEILLQLCKLFLQGNLLEGGEALFLAQREILLAVRFHDALRRVDDVRAVVAIFRKGRLLAQQFQVARVDRCREVVDLIARIVDVVFAVNRIAGRSQEIDEGAADRCAASVPDVQQACRIRAHIFDHDARRIFLRQVETRLALFVYMTKQIIEHIALEVEIDEARPCDLRMIEPVALDARYKLLGNLLRIHAKDARRLHGEVRCKITKLFVRRHFEQDVGKFSCRKHAVGDRLLRRLPNGCAQLFLDVQKNPPNLLREKASQFSFCSSDTSASTSMCSSFADCHSPLMCMS